MNDQLLQAANSLMNREDIRLVGATGLVFHAVGLRVPNQPIRTIIESHRGGVWGEDAAEGSGFPVLRSTNMRGVRAEVIDVAWRAISQHEAAKCALCTGDILVTKSSGSSDLVGKSTLFIHPEDGLKYLFSNFILRLRPNAGVVLPEYLAWFLRSPQALAWRFESQQNAVGLRNLKTEAFLDQPIPVPNLSVQQSVVDYLNAVEIGSGSASHVKIPEWLSEQQRIVANIEQLAAKIEEARGLRQQSEAIVSFLLIQGIKKLLHPAANWRQSTISDCALLSTGTTPPSHREDYFGGKIQWYTPGDLGFEKNLNRSSRTITELAVRDNKARLFEPGTILLVAIGGSLGKVGLTTETCSSNQQITGIKFIAEVDAEFGFWWLRSCYHELRNAAPEATLPILNQRRLGAISFSYPSLDEQRRIVAYLDSLQAQVDRLKTLTAAELEALLPSILDQAFKGEL